jgi:hypothetical protein
MQEGAIMNSPSSFLGKCLTVLIGAALSWATLTNPEFELVAARFLGAGNPNVDLEMSLGRDLANIEPVSDPSDTVLSIPTKQAGIVATSNSAEQNTVSSLQVPSEESTQARIHEISTELKQLGASYLVLERLQQVNGVQYRVRCDLANQKATVKCCFEATRDTALDAMEDVLKAARSNAEATPDFS